MHATDILGYAHDGATYCEDCIPPDGSGCECGATDHNPRCAPIFASEEFASEEWDDPQYCDACRCVVVPGWERECIIDGASGIYVPQRFAREFRNWNGVDPEDWAILEEGPDHEHYWEVWDDVLNGAEFTDAKGETWTLMQDNDLFAIHEVCL